MTTAADLVPLLVVVLLLVTVGGGDVETMAVTVDGDHAVESIPDVQVVGGGTTTVPTDARVDGSVYVIGGTLRVAGTVRGNVTQLAGNVSVERGATVTGRLQTVAGNATVADGATVGRVTTIDPVPRERSPVVDWLFLALQALGLAFVGGLLARRRPALLRNVGDAVTEHTVVTGVVGAFTGLTLLVLFVFMAVTLVLLPVSALGILACVLAVAYGYVALGHLLGRALPVERVDVATAIGTAAVVLVLDLAGRLALLGLLVQLPLTAVGFGAVLVTYFGLQRFEPVAFPDPDEG